MTIPFRNARRVVVNNGAVSTITVTFKAEKASDVHVFAGVPGTVEMAQGVDYTVDGVGAEGFSVTLTNPTGWNAYSRFAVFALYDVDQPNDVDVGGPFGQRFEDALDRQTYMLQSFYDLVARAIRLPVTTPVGTDTDLVPGPNQVIGWNADGTALENKPLVSESIVEAQAAALAAAAAAEDAAAQLVAAISAATDAANAATAAALAASDAAGAAAEAEDALDEIPGVVSTAVEGLLPLSAAKIYGTNDAGTARVALTAGEARTRLSVAAFPSDGTISRSDLDRLGEVVNVADYADPSDARLGMQAAWADALDKNQAVVFTPPGVWNVSGGALELKHDHGSARRIDFKGAGRNATTLSFSSTGNWVELGNRTTALRAENVSFGDMTLVANATQSTGSAIVFEKLGKVDVRELNVKATRQLFKIGDPNTADDVYRMWMSGIYAEVGGSSPPTGFILLQSGSILTISDDCDFNGNGLVPYLFSQENTAVNFDGITCGKITAEMLGLLNVTGRGMSNCRFAGGINDRPTNGAVAESRAIRLRPTNLIFNMMFSDWVFQGNVANNTDIVMDMDPAGGGRMEGVSMIGCNPFFYGAQVVYQRDGNATSYRNIVVANNKIRDCGYSSSALALIRVATGGTVVTGNISDIVDKTGPGYGISWNGTAGKRESSGNKWNGRITADEIGTK